MCKSARQGKKWVKKVVSARVVYVRVGLVEEVERRLMRVMGRGCRKEWGGRGIGKEIVDGYRM